MQAFSQKEEPLAKADSKALPLRAVLPHVDDWQLLVHWSFATNDFYN